MKQFILLVSLILISSLAIRDNYKEQPNLADPINPLSLACPDYLPAENKISEKPNGVIPEAFLNDADQNWYSAAVENIMKEEYSISYSEEIKAYQSPNRANNLQFTYHTNGFTAKPRETKIPLFDVNDRMLSEKEKKYEVMEDWSVIFGIKNEEFGIKNEEFTLFGNKTSIENENIRIDYTNTKEGMRQDFIVKEKISGDEKNLQLLMNVSTDLKMDVNKDAVTFRSGKDGKDKMMYASLKAWDARGKTLDAYFEKNDEKQFAIVVDDSDAEYPVTVDPLSSTPDWTKGGWYTSMRHIVMADAGDINLDGYSDILISSPGEHTSLYAGYVAVYFGSLNGLSNDYKWQFKKLGSAVTEFARSVSGNCDINGDGFGDIIVGEPKYANGQTDEGRIYVFYGSQDGLPDSADWVYESNVEWARLGYSVSTAGDYNGDGYDDVIVGAPGYPNNYLSAHGRVMIFLGSANGLSNDPVYSFINWLDGYTGMGDVVSCAGDINGDGYSDVIAGEPYWPPPPSRPGDIQYESNGRFWVSFGSPSGANINSGRIGEDNYSLFGYSVSSAGDVNSDGFDDVIVGSPNFTGATGINGKTYLYYGSLNGLIDAWSLDNQDPGFGTSVSDAGDVNFDGYDDVIIGAHYTAWDNMSDTSNSSAYVFYGSQNGINNSNYWKYQMNEFLFAVVSSAGDVNADGYSDILVGGLKFEEPYLNELWPWYYAFFGGPTTLRIEADWVAPDEGGDYFIGKSVSSAGDVNGDGFDDFIIGIPIDNNSQASVGKAHLYYGGLSLPGQIPNWTASGGREFGSVVSGAGDFNNDGFDDLIIADPAYNDGGRIGKVYLYLGSPEGLNNVPSWTKTSPGTGGSFGSSISDAGDVNGDGYSDFIIGTGDCQLYNSRYVGAYVYLGNSSGIPDNEPSWTASSILPLEGFGKSVSNAGDVNGDGYDDIIVSAYKYIEYYTGGETFLYFGKQQKSVYEPPDWHIQSDFGFGFAVSDAGDINADGFDDIMVSAINENDFNGRVYFFRGSSDGPQLIADWQITGITHSLFGTEIACAGDYNRDGFSDILIGEIHGYAYLFFGSGMGIGQSMESRFKVSNIQSLSGAMDINGDNNSDVIIGGLFYKPNIQDSRWTAGLYLGKNNKLVVFPKRSVSLQNEQSCINCFYRTAAGIPVEDFKIVFEVKGANKDTAEITTNELGKATYCFTGINWGIDTIIVKAGNVVDTAFVIWDFPSPVEIQSFISSISERNVILSWSTSSELNNSGFEIQRAVENEKLKIENWSKIGFIEGNGTSNESHNYSFTDRNLESGNYKYRLKQIDFNGNFEYFELAEEVSIGIPEKYALSQNYPNPFNPVTTINYDLPADGIVTIKVYDIIGREMKTLVNEMKTAGYHKIQFNAADLASGAYFYQMKAGDFVAVKKFVVLK
ncbi:MAG: FG-GAP repeat protein [Ignavibacteria bacterium]|nr:FG-GAP repeat protein [Ignavibacteria bacterium]